MTEAVDRISTSSVKIPKWMMPIVSLLIGAAIIGAFAWQSITERRVTALEERDVARDKVLQDLLQEMRGLRADFKEHLNYHLTLKKGGIP